MDCLQCAVAYCEITEGDAVTFVVCFQRLSTREDVDGMDLSSEAHGRLNLI